MEIPARKLKILFGLLQISEEEAMIFRGKRARHCHEGWAVGMFLTVLLCAGTALAQLPTATILGVVKDSTGAVIPNASLSARNVETALTSTAVSGADGSYRFVALP